MKLKFWGVRGSIPTPGKNTVRYGGNTPCVEFYPKPDLLFILDAGTGIRVLGEKLLQNGKPIRAYIFLTHTHWDHIQGLPFFQPILDSGNEFTIIGAPSNGVSLEGIISDQMESRFFPLQFSELKSNINFRNIKEESFSIDDVKIRSMYVNHPGYTVGYRFEYDGKSLVYISDNEPFDRMKIGSLLNKVEKQVIDLFSGIKGDPNLRIIEFARDADILIHDSTYTPSEYRQKELWGHSDFRFAVDVALRANVKKLYLFHHGPHRTDDEIDMIIDECRNEIKNKNNMLECGAAQEELEVDL